MRIMPFVPLFIVFVFSACQTGETDRDLALLDRGLVCDEFVGQVPSFELVTDDLVWRGGTIEAITDDLVYDGGLLLDENFVLTVRREAE